MQKKIPKFKNEDEEHEFWSSHDVTDYFNLNTAKRVLFSNLKPSTKTISISLPESMLNSLRILSNKKDIPYQSLIKTLLQEQINKEFGKISV